MTPPMTLCPHGFPSGCCGVCIQVHDMRELTTLRARVTALEGTVATLRAALSTYGVHAKDCFSRDPKNVDGIPIKHCICGLTAALEAK